jgi:hypothetical protein
VGVTLVVSGNVVVFRLTNSLPRDYCPAEQEDVFIGELKFDDKEGNTIGCLRFAFSQLGQEKADL